ncbi:hypothetical protein [Nostoc sp.]
MGHGALGRQVLTQPYCLVLTRNVRLILKTDFSRHVEKLTIDLTP